MAYILSNLIQDSYLALGQLRTTLATGGSTSTAIDTKLASEYKDDDLKNGALFVVTDAAGLGAAPEGEYTTIKSYVQSTNTITFNVNLTAGVVSGDTIAFATPLVPLLDMVVLANSALRSLGRIELPDTSLTTAADTTEYTLPAALRPAPLQRVQVVDSDGEYHDVVWRYVTPAAAGATALLCLPQLDAGYTIRIWYLAVHPKVTVYSSKIHENIHPELAVAATAEKVIEWMQSRAGGTSDFWLQRWNIAREELRSIKRKYPLTVSNRRNTILTWAQ